jgi:thiamine biosynthesis lipoprotein
MTPTPAIALALVISCSLVPSGCKQSYPAYNTRFAAFGTLVDLSIIDVEPAKAERIIDAIRADFEYMNTAWHAWNPGPLERVNELLPSQQPFSVSPSVQPLIERAQELSGDSGGLFNPATGKLTELWGFHVENPECKPPPSRQTITKLVKADPQMSDLHMQGIQLRSDNPAVKIDFGAFAKGYGIDLVIEHLRELGVNNAIVNAGGNLRAIGDRDGHPWRVAIRRPSGTGVFATIDVQGDESVFTSGDYERNFVYKGHNYHHILDPRTGYPGQGTRSVTVLHTDAATAGAAATALFLAGARHWHSVAKAMGIRYVLLVDTADTLHMNPAMAKRTRLMEPDQDIELSPPLVETKLKSSG